MVILPFGALVAHQLSQGRPSPHFQVFCGASPRNLAAAERNGLPLKRLRPLGLLELGRLELGRLRPELLELGRLRPELLELLRRARQRAPLAGPPLDHRPGRAKDEVIGRALGLGPPPGAQARDVPPAGEEVDTNGVF